MGNKEKRYLNDIISEINTYSIDNFKIIPLGRNINLIENKDNKVTTVANDSYIEEIYHCLATRF